MGIFDPALGGDPVLYQHLFWIYSHPAVYIMVLPGLGIVSEILPVFARRTIFGYKFIAFSSVAIALLGSLVWAHHMFTVGMSNTGMFVFSLFTFLVSIPSAIKVFNWVATLYKGSIELDVPILFILAVIVQFSIGGFTGLMLGALAINIHVQDTYFVVGHFHYVMFGGTGFGLFAAIHYWFPKMFGRMYAKKPAVLEDNMSTTLDSIYADLHAKLYNFVEQRVPDPDTAEDILQDVYLKIHTNVDSLRESDRLESWIYQITRNAIIDYYRRARPLDELSDFLASPPDDEPDAVSQLAPSIKGMLSLVPEKYREALELTELQGLSQVELATRLDITVSGAKSRVQRAREKLKEAFLDCCHFEFDRLGRVVDYQSQLRKMRPIPNTRISTERTQPTIIEMC